MRKLIQRITCPRQESTLPCRTTPLFETPITASPTSSSSSSSPSAVLFKRLATSITNRRSGSTIRPGESWGATPDEPTRYQLYDSKWDDWTDDFLESESALSSEKDKGKACSTDEKASSDKICISAGNCDHSEQGTSPCNSCMIEAALDIETEREWSSTDSFHTPPTTSSSSCSSSLVAGSTPAQRKRLGMAPKRRYYCEVCLEKKAVSAFPLGKLASECNHASRCCVGCFSHSITSQLSDKYSKELTCPICPALLDYETISKFATAETFSKYDSIATRECMKALDNWWECPQPDCSYGGVHEAGDKQPIIYCSGCDCLACFVCGAPWHEDLTCKEYQNIQKEKAREQEQEAMNARFNAASENTIDRTTKACPKCKVRIEKNAGCQHMSCSKCRFQYCWDCEAPWSKIMRQGNTAHSKSCPWHTNNLR